MFHNNLFSMKKIRLHKLMVALMLVSTAGFWSCSNDDVDSDGPFITPKPTSLTFDASGNELTKSIAIESNRDWTAAFVESGVDSWISIDKKEGSGNGTISVTVLPNDGGERSATLKLTASTASTSLKITQYAEGGGPIGEVLYKENCGTSVERGDDGWPYVDQYQGWEKGGTLDQAGVTYSGNKANVSNSGNAFAPGDGTPFSGAPYVGMNTAASEFVINSINITGQSNFTFKFGAIFQSAYENGSVFSPVTANSFALSASVNGTDWAPLTYSVEQQGGGNWYMVTTEFKVPSGSAKLYIKYATSNLQANQGYRFDDFTLYQGGNGSMIDPGTPGEKTYITVAELRAKGEVTISENLYVKASVISNKDGGNSTSLKNVVISDGEAGIAVRFTANADYAVGTELELALEGAQLSKYQGLLQLNNFSNAKATTTGETKIIPAKEVTAADIVAGTYESMYVAVPDVEVIAADLGKKMVEDGKHTNIGMEAKTGQNFSMFSASYSVFKDDNVPQGSGTLKGIAGVNIPDGEAAIYQVAPQTATDFAGLTGPRFGGEAVFAFGTPEFTATTIKAGEAIVNGKITIPYTAATGSETYNITVAVSGDAAAGIDPITTAVTKTLSEGTGSIELPITGTPTAAGSVTFTISGIAELTNNTVVATVTAAVDNMADLNTLAANSAYGTYTTTAGWEAVNAAIQQGGDKDANPIFKFIGTADDKAVCLNGKTTTVGVLTSPVLTGGCGELSFKYGNAFGESNGVSVTIDIKQNGSVVKTFDLTKPNSEVVKLTAYDYSVVVNVSGDFQIVITNNHPSNSTKNADRVSIWNIGWTDYAGN